MTSCILIFFNLTCNTHTGIINWSKWVLPCHLWSNPLFRYIIVYLSWKLENQLGPNQNSNIRKLPEDSGDRGCWFAFGSWVDDVDISPDDEDDIWRHKIVGDFLSIDICSKFDSKFPLGSSKFLSSAETSLSRPQSSASSSQSDDLTVTTFRSGDFWRDVVVLDVGSSFWPR